MSSAVTRIVLWRHGNTDWNVEDRIQGQTDVPLNDRGRGQAVAAAQRLAGIRPELLICSDLSRAAHTAAALADRTGLLPETDPRLRERCFGQWETLTAPEVKLRFPDGYARWRAGDPSPGYGVEPLPDLGKRVAEAIRSAAERVPDGRAVLTTHGGAVLWGTAALLGWPDEIAVTMHPLSNCHWTELIWDLKRGWRIAAHNVGV